MLGARGHSGSMLVHRGIDGLHPLGPVPFLKPIRLSARRVWRVSSPAKVGQNPIDYPIGNPGDGSYLRSLATSVGLRD